MLCILEQNNTGLPTQQPVAAYTHQASKATFQVKNDMDSPGHLLHQKPGRNLQIQRNPTRPQNPDTATEIQLAESKPRTTQTENLQLLQQGHWATSNLSGKSFSWSSLRLHQFCKALLKLLKSTECVKSSLKPFMSHSYLQMFYSSKSQQRDASIWWAQCRP